MEIIKTKTAYHSIKNTFLHYLDVYKEFFRTCVSQATSFRLHFILIILVDVFFYFSSLSSVQFIFSHVEKIGPWNKPQLMFFLSVMLAIDQWHMTFISESFWILSYLIRSGGLDFILLKPIGSIFIVCFSHIRPGSILNAFITWPLIFYYGRELHFTFFQFLILPILMILSFSLLVQLEIIISCSMFWMLEGEGINFLRMEFQKLSRWPDFIYGKWTRRLFFIFFPILLVGNAPVRFLFQYNDWQPLLGLIMANVISFFCIKFIWAKSLIAYESASS